MRNIIFLVFALQFRAAFSFEVGPVAAATMRCPLLVAMALKDDVASHHHHQDHTIPEEIRAQRSEIIREKLLGDMEAHPGPKKKTSATAHHDEKAAHPHLTQMAEVLDHHILEEMDERFDINA